ncbi:LEAF RUST 10 DISEASE-RESISTANCEUS RECEPTOR-LIKE PROTEIN KINASE-like 2.1 isoform X2 [Henckelia pumila]|uniref:LEAF RUST 10 DISEASE-RESISTANCEUS RECEPTOR-LIKE PROTEIN KINASE-like 2.1 isoform X2 n=1 Tax=Henckelia pumila TaxID=405737 RepID=UPI003C6E1C50
MAATISLVVFFVLLFIKPSVSKCPKTFTCGNLTSLEFPLAASDKPECGLFTVDCTEPVNPRIQLTGGGKQYQILEKISANKLKLLDPVLENDLNISRSCLILRDLQIPFNPMASLTYSPNITVFTCDAKSDASGKAWDLFKGYRNFTGCGGFTVFYSNSSDRIPSSSGEFQGCAIVQVPVKSNQDSEELFDMVTGEFELEWNVSEDCLACHNRGGQCLADNLNHFQCIKDSPNVTVQIISGVLSMIVVSFIATTMILYNRMKHTRLESLRFIKDFMKNEKDIELFLKNNENFAPRRYKYFELKRITNSFNEKLGKGGYGSVYKGKSSDGRLVAVKILDETKDNVNEFMNEVMSISKTSHVNIVALLGFCFERSKRALVYEFMPNGSLDKFVSDINSSSADRLGWEKFFEIAVGIARGLEYLHRGCSTRILHFDIKPHNILLDKDLNPKISDFGLAKLCPNRSSIVSMLVARGTIGYIAPEVFCRNFGEVSHKSDVYSYGMMVIEIVAGKHDPDTQIGVDPSTEMYFPDYVYKLLEINSGNSYNLKEITHENGWKVSKRKLIIVGLWCIQTDPKNRPSMNRVLEMLEGNLESLQIPPKPHFSSPQRESPSILISESTSTY